MLSQDELLDFTIPVTNRISLIVYDLKLFAKKDDDSLEYFSAIYVALKTCFA